MKTTDPDDAEKTAREAYEMYRKMFVAKPPPPWEYLTRQTKGAFTFVVRMARLSTNNTAGKQGET